MVDESLRASARTSAKVRREIQQSGESNTTLARRLGVNRKTVAKWKARDSTNDAPMGPKDPRSSLVNIEEEAIIIAYRRHTRLSLDDCLIRLRRQIPNLTRSTLHRCLRRNGVSKIGRTCVSQPLGDFNLLKGFYCFEISREEIAFDGPIIGVVYSVFLAVDEVTKVVFAEVVKDDTPQGAAAFLTRLIAEFPKQIIAVVTDLDPTFTDLTSTLLEDMAEGSQHPFAVVCRANSIVHGHAPPKNGPFEST